jgi:abortive infection bacteriophage resistance protein
LDALERIEIGLRVDISHSLGKKDTFAYLKPERFAANLNKKTELTGHHQWLEKHAGLVERSKEDFIKHHKSKYGLPLPI